MPTLQFEHPIKDYATWKDAFDRDPVDRRGLGVRRHVIYRPCEDPHYIVGELEFDTAAQAQACIARLRELWKSHRAAPALAGEPQVRIVETVETHQY
jgi:hypothetical protein